MTRGLVRAAVRAGFLPLLVLLASAFPARAQGWHEDERYGFKLLPPRGWKQIPLKAEENWLVAKYLCDEKDFWTEKGGGWTWDHQSELMVIAFVEEAIKQDPKVAGEGEQGGEGKEDGEDEVIEISRPYRDYEDYLDRTYQGGGFYVASREEGVSNDLPVTRIEVKVEKLAMTGPKRIVTWVYHAPGVDFAVQAEVLEDAYAKRKSAVQSALRSFRTIPRKMGPLPTDGRTDEGVFISFSSLKKGSPEERREKRLESEMVLHARAKKSLTPGWQAREHKRFLVLFDTDPGFADRVAEGCDALLSWAEENLGFIGQGEYVRRPILRICASSEEKESFERGVRGSGSWSFGSDNELVTCKDDYGATGWELGWLNRELLDLWMRDRDDQIWLGLPEWIQHGLYDYVEGARVSGRKLGFKDYVYEMQGFREAVQQGKNIPVRELVQMSQAQFYGSGQDYTGTWNRMAQADMLVRFLLSPQAARSKQTKGLLFEYLKHVRDVVVELESEDVKEKPVKEPTTEEEEEQQYKKRHEAWGTSEREKQVLERTFRRAFAGWSDADWSAFEKAFLRFAS